MNTTAKITVPVALQFCFDDVGWDQGADLRLLGKASRSGIPRYHAKEDYLMLAELGKAIGQKILTPLCLADWDKDNILRGETGVTHDPHGWNRAAEIDIEKFKGYFDILENAQYVEFAIHGLMHGVYDGEGNRLNEYEYFLLDKSGDKPEMHLVSDSEIDRRFDLFFKIYDSWGFTKKIRTFVSPCGMINAKESTVAKVAEILKRRGIRYWTNAGFRFEGALRNFDGITCMKKGGSFRRVGATPPWEAYDLDPDCFVPFVSEGNCGKTNVAGLHWTNLLRYNPQKNLDSLAAWVSYAERERNCFGTLISEDIEFSANQQYYAQKAQIRNTGKGFEIDISAATAEKPSHFANEFYISILNSFTPKSCKGAAIELYDRRDEFTTYKLTHTAPVVVIE